MAESHDSGHGSRQGRSRWVPARFLAAVAVHVPLGVLAFQVPIAAAAHAVLILAYGLKLALQRQTVGVLGVLAYISTAEVLWRMASAPLPYEFGKYSTILLSGCALVRLGRPVRWSWLPAVYVLGLVPSIIVTLIDAQVGRDRALEILRFYFSGPLALAMAVALAKQVRLESSDVTRVFRLLVLPAVAVVSIMVMATMTSRDIVWTTESNFVTTGGFGPNQVSTVLGFAIVAALFVAVAPEVPLSGRIIALAAMYLSSAAVVMTFSRGGVYAALLAVVVAIPSLLKTTSLSRRVVAIAATSVAILAIAVLPRLNEYTGGKLGDRFAEVQATGRERVVREDVELFLAHPLLGVGPGESPLRRQTTAGTLAHTEYSRMLSEHGVFGMLSLVSLLGIVFGGGRRLNNAFESAVRVSLFAWGATTMAHGAMRLVAPGIAFALGSAIGASMPSRTARAHVEGPR